MLTIPDNLGATGAILVSAISTISGRQIPGKLIDHCSKYRQKRMKMHFDCIFRIQDQGPNTQNANFLFGLIATFDVLSVFQFNLNSLTTFNEISSL